MTKSLLSLDIFPKSLFYKLCLSLNNNMYHWIIKPDVMECHVSSFLGPQTHPQLSPDEAGLVLRPLRDQGEDCPQP